MAGENIFVLNSNSLITKEMQNFIVGEGFNVNIITDLDNLVRELEQVKPDLLVLEVIALTTELIDYIEIIRKMSELRDIPHIAVLNRATRNMVLLLVQMGFKEMLVKPFSKKSLLRTIDKVIAPVESGNFRLQKEPNKDGYRIVEILENLDVTNSNKIDGYIEHLIKKGIKKIMFDLHRVSYLDSSGIGILVVCKKKLDVAGGVLKICNLNEQVKKILTSIHIDKIIGIVG